jgi:single-stranded DNA-specific DHH superfamily exonuclease
MGGEFARTARSMKWVAGAGIIGDYGQKDCSAFFRNMGGKRGMARMKKATGLLSAAVTLKGREGAERALKILLREERIEGLLKRKMLGLWKRVVDEEVKKTLDAFRREKEEFPELNLVVFRIRSRLNIVSVISTLLSEKNPDKIIIIYKLSSKGMWKASLRLQSGRLDLGTLTKKCVKGMGSGGGHRQAAGARMSDWNKFRNRIIRELGRRK